LIGEQLDRNLIWSQSGRPSRWWILSFVSAVTIVVFITLTRSAVKGASINAVVATVR
jgi:hypothetical protein